MAGTHDQLATVTPLHPPAQDDHLQVAVTVPRAAQLLDISVRHAYEMVAKGVLPSFHLGKSLRVPVDGLRAAVAEMVEAERRSDSTRPV